MRALGELVAADPNPGAFSHYAGKAMGPAAAFAVGAVVGPAVLVVAAEATAAAQIAAAYIPSIPQWVLALIIMIVFTAINLTTSGSFGEFEFWFSLIKVAFVASSSSSASLPPRLDTGRPARRDLHRRLHAHRHLRRRRRPPHRRLRLRRDRDRRRRRRRDLRPEPVRVQGHQDDRVAHPLPLHRSVAIIVLVLDWTDPRLAESPFVAVLDTAGLPVIASLLAAVIVIALLSSMNANIYGASRMAFSMSRRSMLRRDSAERTGAASPSPRCSRPRCSVSSPWP